MTTVNMLEAKTNLSRLVEAVESGAEAEIVIARNGRPAARLVPIAPKKGGVRLGVAKGLFEAPEESPELDREIEALFYGEPIEPEE
ncbi:MAG: type II toxin-antitoxin system prevent-host-death family antitoxin [Caulobacteraceae bacterium]